MSFYTRSVRHAPREQEVKQILRLDLSVSIEVWANLVRTRIVFEVRYWVVIECFRIGTSRPDTIAAIDGGFWIVVACEFLHAACTRLVIASRLVIDGVGRVIIASDFIHAARTRFIFTRFVLLCCI